MYRGRNLKLENGTPKSKTVLFWTQNSHFQRVSFLLTLPMMEWRNRCHSIFFSIHADLRFFWSKIRKTVLPWRPKNKTGSNSEKAELPSEFSGRRPCFDLNISIHDFFGIPFHGFHTYEWSRAGVPSSDLKKKSWTVPV